MHACSMDGWAHSFQCSPRVLSSCPLDFTALPARPRRLAEFKTNSFLILALGVHDLEWRTDKWAEHTVLRSMLRREKGFMHTWRWQQGDDKAERKEGPFCPVVSSWFENCFWRLRHSFLVSIILSSNTLATWCEEPTHWKTLRLWERLRAKGEGGGWGWDGRMASLTQCIWVWASSWRQWKTGKPGMLQFMGWQRVRYNLATEQQ